MRHLLIPVIASTIISTAYATNNQLERSVCGSLKEPFTFWMWRSAAGSPANNAAAHYSNVQPLEHRTADGRLLRGYRIKSTQADERFIGTVLVAQGNAMLADQLLPDLSTFADAGLDVWIFDYRGYGNSEGKSRLKAMVSDYRELFARLHSTTQGKHFLYGISFGGIVLLNVIGSGIAYDRVVIDSTPSLISNEGCPAEYDPAANLPTDASRFLLIAGEQDNVVSPEASSKLMNLAQSRGARVEIRGEFAHPFMDKSLQLHQLRLKLVRDFFTTVPPAINKAISSQE
ncbi:alpha/beta hydrolase [Permianibacter aggregans]|uniref:Serine aminopeptidase S33 domain-containing protein n=1 Tax=Permianibacter aggregans TaxID=1510150 RepID=A0A4R6UYJ9_9GAMM|nr:alpha/beta fold hydrolase [Permianibacter aggregans]TDQ48724.1 hypothetical protein EV696_106165 [Permianibacter aggregans]